MTADAAAPVVGPGSAGGLDVRASVTRVDLFGLSLVRPYRRGKVPVVLVHGLWSRPESWAPMVAALEADPEIRSQYQFWTFGYRTGEPIALSAERLSAALNRARTTFDPACEDPAFDRLVLVGHSLGGLLSKALATGRVADAPAIGRVVYIATPHRGSPLASGVAGRVATRVFRSIDRASGGDAGEGSVRQLAAGHPILLALETPTTGSVVPYHSIIAARGGSTSDGVVPYTSAHLEGAASERIVQGGQLCQDYPDVIREVGRILRLHQSAALAGRPVVLSH